jgi:hypothetical protein
MKTEIHIIGQISGNSKLRNAIITPDCIEKRTFGAFHLILIFPTRNDAYKALSEGNKSLKSDSFDYKSSRVKYARRERLTYDASIAKIFK